MARLLIATVGTSLLTNRDRPWQGWHPAASLALPSVEAIVAWMITADPAKISAETNTLRAIGLAESDRIELLYSDTPEGRTCFESLQAYYAATGPARAVQGHVIRSLGYQEARFARGLRGLITAALTAHRAALAEGRQPVFCVTGGFKPESAFLTLLGSLLAVEVVYIHEAFREVVRLPPLPVTWDLGLVRENRDFLDWIDTAMRPWDEVEPRLATRPGLRNLVESVDVQGRTCAVLSSAGVLLAEATKARVATSPSPGQP